MSSADAPRPIPVGTPAWFAWLANATTFAFTSPAGRFTARKEARARGGWYWKVYYQGHGTLHRVYLGKAAEFTLDRLNRAAARLAAAAAVPAPVPHGRRSPPPPFAAPNLLATKLTIPPARASRTNPAARILNSYPPAPNLTGSDLAVVK